MQIRPLAAQCGAEITGIDVRDLGEADFAAISRALTETGVILLRDQQLSPQDHIAFARRWGAIDVNNYFPANGGHPEIAEVRKAETQMVNIGGGWHTDHSYDAEPAMGSILVARELPPMGGDTLFTNLGAAYDSLSEGLKATLAGLRAVHSADHIYGPNGVYAKTDQAADLKGQDVRANAVHPAVIRHPVSGRRILYVNPAFTLHFEGWTREESQPLLQYLYAVAMRPEFQCRLNWQPGSVAVWDNRSTWHLAMNDYQGHRRLMHRITISGVALS
ncbi:MAG: taurine dioxygenase [Sphingomonas sp. 28-63-12]|nr:MAG: taurine dioxygenase [Sphingomonas sp. 28-63-12]